LNIVFQSGPPAFGFLAELSSSPLGRLGYLVTGVLDLVLDEQPQNPCHPIIDASKFC
jgi:hypothetical protein